MVNFHRISNITDSLFPHFFKLYTESFPKNERRSLAGLELELDNAKNFHAHALMDENKFIGLFNYWIFDKFNYIEHFAINMELRGQHIGSKALEVFTIQSEKKPVILEVELPEDSISIRRIDFYKRNGFSVSSHEYAQPPYNMDGFLQPMQLMTSNLHFTNSHFKEIKRILYSDVYHHTKY